MASGKTALRRWKNQQSTRDIIRPGSRPSVGLEDGRYTLGRLRCLPAQAVTGPWHGFADQKLSRAKGQLKHQLCYSRKYGIVSIPILALLALDVAFSYEKWRNRFPYPSRISHCLR